MSRNKLKQEKTHKSILAQFFILLVGLGLLCGALFLVLHTPWARLWRAMCILRIS